jgi:NAD(P)-dependent dehydrogenase (short-subunit alcohol dehydrogenase family)
VTSERKLEGRVAIVTGAAGGMGIAMSRALAGAGATIVVMDVRRDALEAAVSKISAANAGLVFPIACDISKEKDVHDAVERAASFRGHVDILINNAGIGPTQLEASLETKSLVFWESDPALWQRTIAIKFCGTIMISRGVVPSKVKSGWGRIVNISTSASTMQRTATSPYGVSKAAIEAETIIWAKDLSGSGVTVNTLLPGGPVDTDFVTKPVRDAARQGSILLLKPEIMAVPLLWLASADSDGVTGCRFVANRWDIALTGEQAADRAREPIFLS